MTMVMTNLITAHHMSGKIMPFYFQAINVYRVSYTNTIGQRSLYYGTVENFPESQTNDTPGCTKTLTLN